MHIDGRENLETGNESFALPVNPLNSISHLFLGDVSVPIFIEQCKSGMLRGQR